MNHPVCMTSQLQDSNTAGSRAGELQLSFPYLDLLTLDELQYFGVYIILFWGANQKDKLNVDDRRPPLPPARHQRAALIVFTPLVLVPLVHSLLNRGCSLPATPKPVSVILPTWQVIHTGSYWLFLVRALAQKDFCRAPPRAFFLLHSAPAEALWELPITTPASHPPLLLHPTQSPRSLALPLHYWGLLLMPFICLTPTTWIPKIHISPSQQLQSLGLDPHSWRCCTATSVLTLPALSRTARVAPDPSQPTGSFAWVCSRLSQEGFQVPPAWEQSLAV